MKINKHKTHVCAVQLLTSRWGTRSAASLYKVKHFFLSEYKSRQVGKNKIYRRLLYIVITEPAS